MNLGDTIRLLINFTTMITMAIVIVIVARVIQKRKQMTAEMGVSGTTYLMIVGVVEIFYTTGLIMILSAMGVNVLEHLQHLEFGKFFKAIDSVDVSKLKFIGKIGWTGFAMNCAVTFIAPGYLLTRGGKKLPKFIYYSAWTEIGLELIVITLVFTSLALG